MNPARLSCKLAGLQGLFPVMKPHGITSAQLLNLLKANLIEELQLTEEYKLKMGHGGTLDMTATGVMVVGIGKDCSLLKNFLHSEKTYTVRSQLGIATDTYNDTGQVTMEKNYNHVTVNLLQEKMLGFLGRIKQVPPQYSALKRHGRRYSDWAREGVELKIEPRLVTCYDLELTEFELPYFSLRMTTGPGFYVRSLVHDLGQAVECCAHVQDLQRIKQGPFHIKDALTEDQWTSKWIRISINEWKNKLNRYFQHSERRSKKDKW